MVANSLLRFIAGIHLRWKPVDSLIPASAASQRYTVQLSDLPSIVAIPHIRGLIVYHRQTVPMAVWEALMRPPNLRMMEELRLSYSCSLSGAPLPLLAPLMASS